jgi:hypothetical protein
MQPAVMQPTFSPAAAKTSETFEEIVSLVNR